MRAAEPDYVPDALDAIREVMSGRKAHAKKLSAQARLPMWQAVRQVARALGATNGSGDYADALEAIRNAAMDGRLTIWGRQELPPPAEPGLFDRRWTAINPMFWRTHRISGMATFEASEDEIHSTSEPLIIGEQNLQRSLQVKIAEIEKLWPTA